MSTYESIPPGSPHLRAPWPTWPPARQRGRGPTRPVSEPSQLPPLPVPPPPLPTTPLTPPLSPAPLVSDPLPAAVPRGNPVTVTVQFTVYGEDAFATAAAVADRLRPIVRAAEPIRLDRGAEVAEPYEPALEAVPATVTEIPVAPLRILSAGYRAELDGTTLSLTRREYDLLLFLAEHPGQVFTRVQLLQTVWQQAFVSGQRTIDVHVRRLRAKLGSRGPLIATVRGVGYRLDHADRVAVVREPG